MEDTKCFKMKVSLNLKAMRLDTGLTEAEVAELLGIDERNIRRWEDGTENIGSETIFKLCSVYKKDPKFAYEIEEGDPLRKCFSGPVQHSQYTPLWRNHKATLRSIINLVCRYCEQEHIDKEEAVKMLRKGR